MVVYIIRMESVNFVYDVNMMWKIFKFVYVGFEDLKVFNFEFGLGLGNCCV